MKSLIAAGLMLFILYNLMLSATQDPPKEYLDGMNCNEAVEQYRAGKLLHSVVNDVCATEAWK